MLKENKVKEKHNHKVKLLKVTIDVEFEEVK
jgi:hypothetical protein